MVKLTNHTYELREWVYPISKYLESNENYLFELFYNQLNSQSANKPSPFPFKTQGSGERVERYLNDNGYKWVSIADLINMDDSIKKNAKSLNALSKKMKVNGLFTYFAQTWVAVKNHTVNSPQKIVSHSYSTIKYDVKETINPKPMSPDMPNFPSDNVNQGLNKNFVDSVEFPVFLIYENHSQKQQALVVIPNLNKNPFIFKKKTRIVKTKRGKRKQYEQQLILNLPLMADKPNSVQYSWTEAIKPYSNIKPMFQAYSIATGDRNEQNILNPSLTSSALVLNFNYRNYEADYRFTSLNREINPIVETDIFSDAKHRSLKEVAPPMYKLMENHSFDLQSNDAPLRVIKGVHSYDDLFQHKYGWTLKGVLMKTTEEEEQDGLKSNHLLGVANQSSIFGL